MNEVIENDIEELPFNQFLKIFEMLKKKPGNKYDFTVKSGKSYQLALFNLFQLVWRYETIPEKWRETTLVQLFKGRGSFSVLDNMRHLHLKDQTFKYFCHIVLSYAKETLLKNMTKFQIACKPGHRPSEHLFVIKSVINHYYKNGQGILINSFDLRKFYDSEHIYDCMNELYSSQLKGKLYRLIYEMNKNIRIRVKTPVGLTKPEDTGPTIGQGGVDACTISAVNIDNGVDDAFVDSGGEIVYSGLK